MGEGGERKVSNIKRFHCGGDRCNCWYVGKVTIEIDKEWTVFQKQGYGDLGLNWCWQIQVEETEVGRRRFELGMWMVAGKNGGNEERGGGGSEEVGGDWYKWKEKMLALSFRFQGMVLSSAGWRKLGTFNLNTLLLQHWHLTSASNVLQLKTRFLTPVWYQHCILWSHWIMLVFQLPNLYFLHLSLFWQVRAIVGLTRHDFSAHH